VTSRVIADLPRNGRERVRVAVSEFKGARFADLRIYGTAADGSTVPTKQGVAIRRAILSQVIAALQEAERELNNTTEGA
jgi:hypothetical protein